MIHFSKPVLKSAIVLDGVVEDSKAGSRPCCRVIRVVRTQDGGFRLGYNLDYTKFTKEDRLTLIQALIA